MQDIAEFPLPWNYDRAELVTDAVIHVLGVVLAVSGACLLLIAAMDLNAAEYTAVLIYAVGLTTVLTVSALYNMWPPSRAKWLLRRLDHSAIYLLIAGTYTPFMTQIKTGLTSLGLLVGIWLTAILGMILKLALPGRFDRLSILLYLALGWSGAVFYESIFAALPSSTIGWLCVGGILYSLGVVFHVWERLRFQNAIWHGFVLTAAACHYGAVLDCMILARS